MSEAWLTTEEVTELTDCSRRSLQCSRLAEMGIPFQPNYAGRPLVERSAVLRHKERALKKSGKPNWDAIRAAQPT